MPIKYSEHDLSATAISNPSELNDTFGNFARFYDDDYRNYSADIELLLSIAEEYGGPILELGSGTGRVLLPLAMQGHKVTGVDISPALHRVAREKLAASDLMHKVELVEADICTIALPFKEYAFALCVSNTLMHCTSPLEQIAVLSTAYDHLSSGAVLVIDLFNPDITGLLQTENVAELADSWINNENSASVLKWSIRTLDIGAQIQDTLFIYEEIFSDGQTRRTLCPFQLRFLWQNEGELMLQAAGFEVEDVWGDFDCNPYDSSSERLIFFARKP